jgi:hypothetical protein
MILPDGFQFSQGSLQDFIDCRRRFQLRHLMHLSWPAAVAEPIHENEHRLLLGTQFHHLIHQYLVGIPAERISATIHDEELLFWWNNYLTSCSENNNLHITTTPGNMYYPEISLSFRLDDHRLVAKYDLVILLPDSKVFIFDWKTTQVRPKRKWLSERIQTRLYPYLLIRAGIHLSRDIPIAPGSVEMIYWFASFPEQSERFPYQEEQYKADEEYITGLIETIRRLETQDFTLTSDENRCRYCVYRSLCNRGVDAGPVTEMEVESETEGNYDISLEIEQIPEIEF